MTVLVAGTVDILDGDRDKALAASAALVLASAIGVLAGSVLSEYINQKVLHYIAGAGFVAIGAWTLVTA